MASSGRTRGEAEPPSTYWSHSSYNAPQETIGFLASRAHWWLICNILSTRTPGSFFTELLSSRSTSTLYWCRGLLLPMWRIMSPRCRGGQTRPKTTSIMKTQTCLTCAVSITLCPTRANQSQTGCEGAILEEGLLWWFFICLNTDIAIEEKLDGVVDF